MKKTLVIIHFLLLLAWACQSADKRKNKPTTATDSLINNSANTAPALYREGAKLIAANDCLTCHDINKTLVGPSYKDIARKYHHYEGTIDNLVSSIIQGSRGIWGSAKAMTPHPNLAPADARKMVQYIFSLDSTDEKDTSGTRILK